MNSLANQNTTVLPQASDQNEVLVSARGLERIFPGKGGRTDVRAVSGVDLEINKGETLGLVGESGSGKSTLGRMLAGLDRPTQGEVSFKNGPIYTEDGPEFRAQRGIIQFVFQDPMSALNQRLTVERQVAEAVRVQKKVSWKEATEFACEYLANVGVNREMASRFVHQLSGGQRQRVVIARSLILNPEFVVFDEPVSALDLSIQAQILKLMSEMRETLNLTSVFITHDLRVVRYISDRIAVLYLGHIVEIGDADEVYHKPKHPYTQALLSAIPHINPDRRPSEHLVKGEISTGDSEALGCVFANRCPLKTERCTVELPDLRSVGNGVQAACHFVEAVQ